MWLFKTKKISQTKCPKPKKLLKSNSNYPNPALAKTPVSHRFLSWVKEKVKQSKMLTGCQFRRPQDSFLFLLFRNG